MVGGLFTGAWTSMTTLENTVSIELSVVEFWMVASAEATTSASELTVTVDRLPLLPGAFAISETRALTVLETATARF